MTKRQEAVTETLIISSTFTVSVVEGHRNTGVVRCEVLKEEGMFSAISDRDMPQNLEDTSPATTGPARYCPSEAPGTVSSGCQGETDLCTFPFSCLVPSRFACLTVKKKERKRGAPLWICL